MNFCNMLCGKNPASDLLKAIGRTTEEELVGAWLPLMDEMRR